MCIPMDKNSIELFTSTLQVEVADGHESTPKRVIVKIPLINEGANSKNLLWTQETMQKVAHMFRGVPFRFDINGQNEGSHTRDRLSSPFYDVGWTYSDEGGSYYDPEKKTIWVKGEITHPEVINKLMRQTTDGKREINFASMGAMIDPKDTMCSVCNKSPFGTCGHVRGQTYNGKVCNMIPKNISKALHVALTNDPADKVAEIAEAIFQDMNNQVDSSRKNSPVPVAPNLPGPSDQNDLRGLIETIVEEVMRRRDSGENKKTELSEEGDNKMEDEKKVKEEVRTDVEEKSVKQVDDSEKSVEDKKKKKKKQEEEPVEQVDKSEDKQEEEPVLQENDVPVVEPEVVEEKVEETTETPNEENPKEEVAEEPKEEEKPEMADDDVEFKITGRAAGQQKIITQDNSRPVVETASNDVYAQKYKNKLVLEVADSYVKFKKANSKNDAMVLLQDKSIEQLELLQDAFDGIVMPETKSKPTPVLQDNAHIANDKFANDVPEFGGFVQDMDPYVEVQDMSPEDRRSSFGEYGAFDVCFNPTHAPKYRK